MIERFEIRIPKGLLAKGIRMDKVFTESMREAPYRMRESVQRQFAGQNFAPLAPSTLRRKKFWSMLIETGDMHATQTKRGNFWHVEKVGPFSASIGTLDPKSKFHHTGTRRMPKRQTMVMDDKCKKQIRKAVAEDIIKALSGRTSAPKKAA